MTPLLKEMRVWVIQCDNNEQTTYCITEHKYCDVLYSESNRFTMNGVKQQYIHFYKLRNECST